VAKIGHFGFFRPEHRDTLWRGAAEWIEAWE
jgi:predicted alpha/beta hydrolase